MPDTLQTGSFVLGAVFLLIAILGGNFKIFSAEVSGTVGTSIRWIAGITGLVFIVLAFRPIGQVQTPVTGPLSSVPSPRIPTTKPERPGSGQLPASAPTVGGTSQSAATVAASDESTEAVTAMNWIGSRCGPGIALVVPSSVGSAIDRAARSFAKALGNSGVRPVPIVINVPGVFFIGGNFSVQKFDEWHRQQGKAEGCLLAIVPSDVRDQFARPRFNAAIGDKSYGIVLPRGVLSETAIKWNAVFRKAVKDADFVREIEQTNLRVDLVLLP
jgi:hypothetical protein